ncbi:MAG TPA: hypothetical protein VNX02_10785 [Steroidobacteraceae bacterium]|nr:hypothetical protein [Steroidobacteraceae bacterium]
MPDVAQLCLSFAADLLNLAFYFQLLIARDLSGDFIDLAFYFMGPALNLVFVYAHNTLLMIHAGKMADMRNESLQSQKSDFGISARRVPQFLSASR